MDGRILTALANCTHQMAKRRGNALVVFDPVHKKTSVIPNGVIVGMYGPSATMGEIALDIAEAMHTTASADASEA